MFAFGSGALIGVRTDVANATPVNFGLVQEVTLEDNASIKELMGQFQRPIAIARGGIKTTGKAKLARISGIAMASLYFGAPAVAGQLATSFLEAAAVPAASPYTVAAANAATAQDDLGVTYAATGLPLIKVASAPAAGQYSVANGTYSFAAADSGKAVLLTYTYGVPGSGQKIVVTNQLMSTTPTFMADLYTTFQGQTLSVRLNQCTSSKLSFGTKLEDFTIPELDFSCFADAAGNVMTWSYSEVS